MGSLLSYIFSSLFIEPYLALYVFRSLFHIISCSLLFLLSYRTSLHVFLSLSLSLPYHFVFSSLSSLVSYLSSCVSLSLSLSSISFRVLFSFFSRIVPLFMCFSLSLSL